MSWFAVIGIGGADFSTNAVSRLVFPGIQAGSVMRE
jgi:hypothetical protein